MGLGLRERLRRALHEFTRPDDPRVGSNSEDRAASQVLAPQPLVSEADAARLLRWSRTPVDNGPWQCCYCNEHLYSPFAPDTPLVLSNSIVHQKNGHTSCGRCWLNEHVQWPCNRYHKLPGRSA